MNASPAVELNLLRSTLSSVVSPWVAELDLEVLQAALGEVVLALPVQPRHVHGGGVLSGQTLMAAADTAMILAVVTRLGEFKPMTTVQLQTSFLKSVPAGSAPLRVVASVLRMGRKLVFGEIHIRNAEGDLVAHATTTYALL